MTPLPEPAAPVLTETARAKVNLYLHVTGRRDDGYHLIESLFVFAGACDRLYGAPDERLTLRLCGPRAEGLEAGENNLVLRAARALRQSGPGLKSLGPKCLGARLTLEKNLPVAAGLGGGSADAAAALRLLSRLWQRRLTPPELHLMALGLGADVPACLDAAPKLVSGIGEKIAPVGELPPLYLLLVHPGIALSTARVFAALASRGGPYSDPGAPVFEGLGSAGFIAILKGLRNDLEPAAMALAPEIRTVLKVIADLPGCHFSRMSGSGSSCFGVFQNRAALEEGLAWIAAARPEWWVWGGPVEAGGQAGKV